MDYSQRSRSGFMYHLKRTPFFLHKGGTEDFVTLHHLRETLLQSLDIERPSHSQCGLEVVGDARRIELFDKPDALLRKPERNLLSPGDCAYKRHVGSGGFLPSNFELPG